MFGNKINIQDNLLRVVNKRNGLNGFEASIYLLEEYLHNFGIVDLDNPLTSPLALVELHDKEGLFELDLESKRMDDYLVYRVWDSFHVNFNEFIAQPRYRLERMLSKLRPALKARLEALAKEEREDKQRWKVQMTKTGTT